MLPHIFGLLTGRQLCPFVRPRIGRGSLAFRRVWQSRRRLLPRALVADGNGNLDATYDCVQFRAGWSRVGERCA